MRMVLIYLAFAVVLLPPAIYFYFFFTRFFTLFGWEKKTGKNRLASLGVVILLMIIAWPMFRLGGVLVLHLMGACIVLDIVHVILVKWCLKRKYKTVEFLHKSGIVAAVLVVALMWYGYENIQQVRQVNYVISSEKVDHPLRIAAVSDLHMGTTMDAETLQKWCDKIERQKPDLLVLVGDMFDESTGKDEMLAAAKALGGVKSTYGSYFVWGNHDPNAYVKQRNYSRDELVTALGENGIQILEDSVVNLDDDYDLIGRLDARTGRTSSAELTKNLKDETFKIVLEHQPTAVSENEAAGMDLQISGHTHAGQIWPTGWLMEVMHINDWNYGYLHEGNLHVIVTSGIGGWGYPIRTGGYSEYVIIDVGGKIE